MFDFSLAELVLVVVVAVVFIGPKELPVVIRTIAKAMRAIKELGREIHDAFDDLAKESGVTDIKDDLQRELKLIRGDDGLMYEAYDVTKVLPSTGATPIHPVPYQSPETVPEAEGAGNDKPS